MDSAELQLRLQQVLAYRDLCRHVRRSGRENFFFAAIFAIFAAMAWQNGRNDFILLLYTIFIAAELLIGLYKWFFPSAEGVLFDVLILLAFAGLNGLVGFLQFQIGIGPNPVLAFLVAIMLLGAWRQWQQYRVLRVLFAERPSRQHLRWFDELVQEIRQADPQSDELAVDLPTQPHLKAKLLGELAFCVDRRSGDIQIVSVHDFHIERDPVDQGTGRRPAQLHIGGIVFPPFQIDDASWDNYQRWKQQYAPAMLQESANPLGQFTTQDRQGMAGHVAARYKQTDSDTP